MRATTPGDALRAGLRGVGQTLITIGVVLLLFCVYELYVTNLVTEREQDRLGDALRQTWAEPLPAESPPAAQQPVAQPPAESVRPAAAETGTGIAVLRIPALGADYAKVVVEGTDVDDLKKGPGRMRHTAPIGTVGNTVISGHRTTYGAPFERFDELRPGDAVVLETRDIWFTYRVTGTEIVAPTAIEVTYPVPGQLDAPPTQSLLTLTTCHPRFSARERMVVSGVLESELSKADGVPAALAEA